MKLRSSPKRDNDLWLQAQCDGRTIRPTRKSGHCVLQVIVGHTRREQLQDGTSSRQHCSECQRRSIRFKCGGGDGALAALVSAFRAMRSRSTSCAISRPPPRPLSTTARAGQRHYVRGTLFHGDEHCTRCAASTRCAAQQRLRPRLVGVARGIQDTCSQPTALPPCPSRFRQAIPRSGDSAQAEHAKVSLPSALRVPRQPSERARRYVDVVDEPRHLGRP
jgi:hypothetical protein